MDLAKLVVAIGIGVFLCLFISEVFSLVYPIPNPVNSFYSSYDGGNNCRDLITQKCGDSSSITNYTAYYECTADAYSSSEYRSCTSNLQKSQEERLKDYQNQLKIYQIASVVIFGLLGILLILVGFFAIEKRSIGSGLIFGGLILIPFGSVIATISSLFSKVFGALGSMEGAGDDGLQTIIQIIRIVGYALVVFVLMLMAYVKLEKKGHAEDEE